MKSNLFAVLSRACCNIARDISNYVVNPKKDFSRNRKLPFVNIMRCLMLKGAEASGITLLNYFHASVDTPTESALIQQRHKLTPEAFSQTLKYFYSDTAKNNGLRILAVDGTSLEFSSNSKYSSKEYFVESKNFYQMHITAMFDLINQQYCDAVIQPIHQKNEFAAFTEMIIRQCDPNTLFVGDIGFCSYNNIANIIAKDGYFLLRCKDIHSKGIASNFNYPTDDEFDVDIDVAVVRTNKKISSSDRYIRRVGPNVQFDFLEPGSDESYNLSFRVVRFKLKTGNYECILTNLPREKYPPEEIKRLYNMRWGIETSFRHLKHAICLKYTSSYKPVFIMQEVWAALLMYNFTSFAINQSKHKKKRKFDYKANFSKALAICKQYISNFANKININIYAMIEKCLIPIRNNRCFERNKTDHARNPKGFTYRPQ
ncbi:MAG: IS4 family transposase [Lachnospiraceae bacterium]|nr:IS4 family transposase [Lachnospiraceae bacterium]